MRPTSEPSPKFHMVASYSDSVPHVPKPKQPAPVGPRRSSNRCCWCPCATIDPDHVLQIELAPSLLATLGTVIKRSTLYAKRRCARLEPRISESINCRSGITDASIAATDVPADAVDEIRFGIVSGACRRPRMTMLPFTHASNGRIESFHRHWL